ncbi:MAG TPA: hypothetical protein PLP81_00010 [Saprospiraceae bacterium]|nr:hypothetical protein [Saprospiraceae bacterium]
MNVRFFYWVVIALLIFMFGLSVLCPAEHVLFSENTRDTIRVKAGTLVILRDSFFVAASDTLIFSGNEKIRLRKDPYAHTKAFYDSLSSQTERKRLLGKLYAVFVRDNAPVNTTGKNSRTREDELAHANGKFIRSVRTFNVPLLDGNVRDTAWVTRSLLSRLISFHPQTNKSLILTKALPQTGTCTDGESLADAERLVRAMPGIRDAELYVLDTESQDSVDIVIVTQDVFPIRAAIGVKGTEQMTLALADRNINGYALELGAAATYQFNNASVSDYKLSMRKANVLGDYGDFEAEVSRVKQRTEQYLSFDRSYLTEDLPDLGGFKIGNVGDEVTPDTVSSAYQRLQVGGWYGRVFSRKDNWNIIPAVSADGFSFAKRPETETVDFSLRDRLILLGSVNVMRRAFIRTALVTKFGVSEYFPVGLGIQLTAGREVMRETGRNYLAAGFTWARFQNDVGFLGLSGTGAAFQHDDDVEDIAMRLRMDYFSPLLKWGRVRFRQFANIRFQSNDRVTYLPAFSIDQVGSDSTGKPPVTHQYVVYSVQTIWHMPWMLYGFRFSFFDSFDCYDMLLNGHRNILPVVGAGIRVQNDYLTYSVLSVQFQWVPESHSVPEMLSIRFTSMLPTVFGGLGIGRPSLPY